MHTDLIAAALAMAGMRTPSDSRIRDRIAMMSAQEKRQIDAAVDRAIDESADPASALAASEREARALLPLVRARFA